MQELQVRVTQAQVEIIDREKFEQGINEVVTRYENYTVTAATIKEDKQVLADLRKLKKQISDERIKIKRELSQSADEFDGYIKTTSKPLDDTIDKIAQDVKEFEDHQKALRLDTVKSYIAKKSAEYMIDPRVFDGKITEYLKATDFMADGVTLKKGTMKSLDDIVTFEYQKQQEFEQAKRMISGQCAEYGMNDQPYIRQLKDLTVMEVLEQIKSDYLFEQEKLKMRQAQEERERLLAEQRAKEQAPPQKSTETPKIDPETGEILEVDPTPHKELEAVREPENSPKRYTQKMTLEIYFEDTAEKDRFKAGLTQLGFDFQRNYWVNGYQRLDQPLTQEELEIMNLGGGK